MKQDKIALVICGPTASGKSDLGLKIAKQIDGEIICADAMQFYKDLPLLSAAPSIDEKKQIPHHLFGILSPDQQLDAQQFQSLATEKINEILARNKTPVIIGGTGLYIQALLKGISEMPEIPLEIRQRTAALYDKIGEEKFRERLAEIDLDAAKNILPNDRQRLIRAYEVFTTTQIPFSTWKNGTLKGRPENIKFLPLFIDPDRQWLYKRCNQRFQLMRKKGAIEEVTAMLKKNPAKDWPIWRILGAPQIASFCQGKTNEDEMITKATQLTRNYAKRQITWFRNQLMKKAQAIDFPLIHITSEEEKESVFQKIELTVA